MRSTRIAGHIVVAGFAAFVALDARAAQSCSALFSSEQAVLEQLAHLRVSADEAREVGDTALARVFYGHFKTLYAQAKTDGVDLSVLSRKLEDRADQSARDSQAERDRIERAIENERFKPFEISTGNGGKSVEPSFSPDGNSVAIPTSNGVVLFDLATRDEIGKIPTKNRVHVAAFSPDGTRIATIGKNENKVEVYDIATGRAKFSVFSDKAQHLAWSADGKWLLVSTPDGAKRQRAKLLNSETGDVQHDFPHHELASELSAFSADGTVVASWSDNHEAFDLHSLQTGQSTRLAGRKPFFSPDGSRLFATVGFDVYVYDAKSYARRSRFSHGSSVPTSNLLTPNPDGSRLTLGHWPNLDVLDTKTGNQLFRITADSVVPGGHITQSTFTADGERLITITASDSVNVASVYDAATGAFLYEMGRTKQYLFTDRRPVSSPAGRYVAFADTFGKVFIHYVR